MLVIIASFTLPIACEDGACNSIKEYSNRLMGVPRVKTCLMKDTAIRSTGFLITSVKNKDIEGFELSDNWQVAFLPENAAEKFPNLIILRANDCSIKAISRENFTKLTKLRWLQLCRNKIVMIASNTFEGLVALEDIRLGEKILSSKFGYFEVLISDGNKIKALNGRAFIKLRNLKLINLESNECIDESFELNREIGKVAQTISKRCRFSELDDKLDVRDITTQLIAVDTLIKSCVSQAEEELKAAEKKIEIIEDELETANSARREIQKQLSMISEVYERLEAQFQENCNTKLELMVQEISSLSRMLQDSSAMIKEKNLKIDQLESLILLFSLYNFIYVPWNFYAKPNLRLSSTLRSIRIEPSYVGHDSLESFYDEQENESEMFKIIYSFDLENKDF